MSIDRPRRSAAEIKDIGGERLEVVGFNALVSEAPTSLLITVASCLQIISVTFEKIPIM